MVLTTEDFGGGGGWSLFGNNATTDEEGTLEERFSTEELEKLLDQLKPFGFGIDSPGNTVLESF